MNKGNKLYEGKAKIIYETKDKDIVIQHFKDDATAFNNLKKSSVEGKGVLNNRISEYILTNLSQCGIKTHFIKRLNMREQLIKKAEIFPIEFIVRNVATGSLTKRLGISEGTVLDGPLLEYCYKKDELQDPIISKEHIYLFGWATEKEIKIIDKISNDKFGRLINNTSRISLTWEAYMWCLLPIFYKTNNIDGKLIKLMVTWYFRNIQFKTRSFNNLCYSNEFIRITNEVLMDEHYDYYTHLNECIVKNKDDSINDENYLQTMKVMKFKSTNPTYLLLFLETCINTDLHRVSLDYTLEHVYCQKHKSNLKNPSLMDYIGNLTLIEGKNSDNGHKGNSALGAKTYDKKIISYKGSSSSVTRDIPEKYTDFEEEHIIERNAEIVSLLNRYTNY
mgnify:CR=1 FL=1